jgi:hypothetical protein
MEKLWRNPLTSPLRGLSSGEFQKMFFYRHLGLGQGERYAILYGMLLQREASWPRAADKLVRYYFGEGEEIPSRLLGLPPEDRFV